MTYAAGAGVTLELGVRAEQQSVVQSSWALFSGDP